MKLSNYQIEALVNEFDELTSVRKVNEKTKAEMLRNSKNISDAKKYLKIYQSIPACIRKNVFYSHEKTEKNFLNALVDVKFVPKKQKFTRAELRDIIILESIDSVDSTMLLKNVTKKIK